MSLVVFCGSLLQRQGELATSLDCCCDCPPVDGCNLVVILNYIAIGGDVDVEIYNHPAEWFIWDQYANCELAFNIADIPVEYGGDIGATVTVGRDANCNLSITNVNITRTVDAPENDQDCADGVTNCVPIIVFLDCNPLP